jgi:hypothetical protein
MFYEVVLDDFRGSANCKKLKSCGLIYAGGKFPLSPSKIYNPIFIK